MAILANGISMKSQIASSGRDLSVDFAKGMLMWCVVYGHMVDALLGGMCHATVWLHVFVRTFDLPFFMILSGYFLKKSLGRRCAWEVAINRISMIFIPIAVWTLLRGHLNVFCGTYYFLWAVLVSSLICVAGRFATSRLYSGIGRLLEAFLYLGVVVLLHFINVPWNLFYLFPFFVVGYYLSDVQFSLSRWCYFASAVVMVAGLCFWSPGYTPWDTGALAWKDDAAVIGVYLYRFILAVVGVFVMAKVFDVIRDLLGQDSIAVRSLLLAGRETLAIYILQSILVERIVRRGCGSLWAYLNSMPPQCVVNLVGYVVAPLVSFVFIVFIASLVRKIKDYRFLKYVFGFKVK